MHEFDDDPSKDKPEKIQGSLDGDGRFVLKNLQRGEIENLEGMMYNHFWISVDDDGRLSVVRRRELLPAPAEDENMLPFWRRATPGGHQMQLFEVDIPKHSFPSIIIQHLCGYGYTPENYAYQAELLESYGFVCLRSRRGEDARYHEMWLLSGLWSASGVLQDAIGNSRDQDKKCLKKAIDFLCRNASFGSLDVSFQRAAMTID